MATPTTFKSGHLATLKRIPISIWGLGLVSLFMDISSELIHSLLPIFLVTTLGASTATLGVIEGIAEATAAITKAFSGVLSDQLGKRKLLTGLGYGLAALTKPLFPLAHSIEWVFLARFIDRIGKGIRGAPRDAMISDLAPPELRGASFGLRQTLDTAGAFAGPLLAIVLMYVFAGRIRLVLWVAVIPAFLSVATLIFLVREPAVQRPAGDGMPRWHIGLLREFRYAYWWVLCFNMLATLARFSEAFLLLKAQQVGMATTLVPMMLVVMNIAYFLSAYPAGALSDYIGRIGLLSLGLVILALADLVLAASDQIWLTLIGVLLWGLHMGLTQGLFASLVADTSPAHLRGTAFGLFNMLSGVALLLASVLAGVVWEALGSSWTFIMGAVLVLVSLGALALRPTQLATT